jgi:type IV pilus biogenesis protein CpaD/CtpE
MGLRTQPVAVAIAITLILAGCAASPDSVSGELSLVETKSSVQLLRNEAAGRLDASVVSDIRKTTDQSFPCYNEEKNPGGLVRQWQSSSELVLVTGTDRLVAAEQLVKSFVDQGWTAEEISTDASTQTSLSSPKSLASIEVSSADLSAIAIIRITATGPCVTTGGPDSDEVTSLE